MYVGIGLECTVMHMPALFRSVQHTYGINGSRERIQYLCSTAIAWQRKRNHSLSHSLSCLSLRLSVSLCPLFINRMELLTDCFLSLYNLWVRVSYFDCIIYQSSMLLWKYIYQRNIQKRARIKYIVALVTVGYLFNWLNGTSVVIIKTNYFIVEPVLETLFLAFSFFREYILEENYRNRKFRYTL